MRQITAAELAAWLADPGRPRPLLLDVREPWEIERAALPDITAMPMQTVPRAFATLDADRTTVCICHHGARSLQVALFLEARGFTDVVNLSGGIDAWSRQVDSSVAVY